MSAGLLSRASALLSSINPCTPRVFLFSTVSHHIEMVINEFLRRCLAKLQKPAERVTAVLGNEGGDMDSIVGSIYLAFLLDSCTKFGIHNPIPVINFQLDDLALRGDVTHFFSECGVDASLLISAHHGCPKNFIDLASSRVEGVVLYDHNKLQTSQSHLSKSVLGIVDHHADEGLYTAECSSLRVIRTVGSACTLVTELMRENAVEVQLPKLLMAPIIVDSVNLDPSQKKVTEEDIAAFKWLDSMERGSGDHNDLYSRLSKWKADIFDLSVEQNLRRDYKHFNFSCDNPQIRSLSTGISSIPCSFHQFESRYTISEISNACSQFLRLCSLQLIIIAFAGEKNGVHSRDIAFFATGSTHDMFSAFLNSHRDGIRFSEQAKAAADSDYSFVCYSLSDVTLSRKRLVPSIAQFLSGSSL